MILRFARFRGAPESVSNRVGARQFKAGAAVWVRGGLMLLCTALSSTLSADSAPGTRDSFDVVGPAGPGEFYDDPNADYSDDGSRTVKLSPADNAPEALTPISPLEESGLLGNWGDSLEEAED